jgi:glycosyltransferase involved in cell wall biosynthesis
MHILIIPSWYATPQNPIRGSFFREQAQALRRAGHQVGLLVPPSKARSWHGLAESRRHWRSAADAIVRSDDDGIPVYRMPWWGWQALFSPRQRGELALSIFDRYCREVGTPDVLHAHSILYGGYLAAYIGQQRQVPALMTEHSTNYFNRWLILPGQKAVIDYTLRHLNAAVAVSPALAAKLGQFSPASSIEVIGNLVDTDFFAPSGLQLPAIPFTFAAVGSLTRRKGHHILIKAFSRVFRGQPVTLRIAGAGWYRQRLERLIQQCGVSGQVELLGLQTRERVRSLLQQSHVLASGSFLENHPVNVLEGMAAGKPIVATACRGTEDIVTDETGLIVPIGDVSAMAQAMQQMRNSFAHYDSLHIRQLCIERYSEAAIVGQLEAVYERIVAHT